MPRVRSASCLLPNTSIGSATYILDAAPTASGYALTPCIRESEACASCHPCNEDGIELIVFLDYIRQCLIVELAVFLAFEASGGSMLFIINAKAWLINHIQLMLLALLS